MKCLEIFSKSYKFVHQNPEDIIEKNQNLSNLKSIQCSYPMQWNACLNNVKMTIYSNKSADLTQNLSKFYLIFWRGEIDKSIGNSRDPEKNKTKQKYLESNEVEGYTLPGV